MEIAKYTGFTKRRTMLIPETLVKVFTFGLLNIPNPSLNEIASKCEELQPGLQISKVAIHKRLKKTSMLLQEVFKETMQTTINNMLAVKITKIFSQFKDVKICDSTKITLPNKLANIWPGLGGSNAKSALKIQGVYSLVSSLFSNIELTKAPGSDTTYTDKLLTLIDKNELLITDLGYFSKAFFEKLADKGAYYLTRIHKKTMIYIENKDILKKIDIAQFLKNKTVVDEQVLIGTKYKKQLKCRLVAIRLPEEVVNQRRRKANKKSKSKQLSKRETELLAWNIIITNVSKENLSPDAICDIYRARWQIELVFKSLKSYLNIDKIGNPGQYQLECLIYGRLITSIIIFKIYNVLYPITYRHFKRGVSLLLFVKLFKAYSNIFSQNITCSIMTINLLRDVFVKISKRSLHEKRRRKTTLELLQEYLIPKINFHNMA
jgi:hypothetical protein